MSEVSPARIGVIADTSLQRHVLQQALSANGYNVVLNCDPARIEESDLVAAQADLWLVDLAQTEDSPLVNALLERDSCPVLFGEGHAPERHSEHYPRWERRMFGKLKRLVGDPSRVVGPRLEVLRGKRNVPPAWRCLARCWLRLIRSPGNLPAKYGYWRHRWAGQRR
jgi:chemosensory pili system protein ChpB (putative protein-glutamate methylesterase)